MIERAVELASVLLFSKLREDEDQYWHLGRVANPRPVATIKTGRVVQP